MLRSPSTLDGPSWLLAFALGAALTLACILTPTPGRAALGERVVTDWATGIAIDGFDPVSYFVDAAPRRGLPAYEAEWAGVTWRFANEGNRAVFLADPEVYAPRFGGHSPVAVAHGFAGAGDPRVWAIVDGHLYFFTAPRQRHVFQLAGDALARDAERLWPEVSDKLVR